MNYKRTVEDFKRCDGKAQTKGWLPHDKVRRHLSVCSATCLYLVNSDTCPRPTTHRRRRRHTASACSASASLSPLLLHGVSPCLVCRSIARPSPNCPG